MANLDLFQTQTSKKQDALVRRDLDCMANYVGRYALETHKYYNLEGLFRLGQPAQWDSGEIKVTGEGDLGMMAKPTPNPDDGRLSYRETETPFYEHGYKSLHFVEAAMTQYPDKNSIELKNPEYGEARHLRALSRSLPKYLKYLAYKVFIGKERAKEKNGYEVQYFEQYIEGKKAGIKRKEDGTYEEESGDDKKGYFFYHHRGVHAINLSEAIDKPKRDKHPLKEELEAINAALRADSRKVEIETKTGGQLYTKYLADGPQHNLTIDAQASLLFYLGIREFIMKMEDAGCFPETGDNSANWKFKHKDVRPKADGSGKEEFEVFPGINHPTMPSDCYCVISRNRWEQFMLHFNLTNPVVGNISLDGFGMPMVLCPCLDDDECIIMHRDLLQFGMLPRHTRKFVNDYGREGTYDVILRLGHTLHMFKHLSSAYLKEKKN